MQVGKPGVNLAYKIYEVSNITTLTTNEFLLVQSTLSVFGYILSKEKVTNVLNEGCFAIF